MAAGFLFCSAFSSINNDDKYTDFWLILFAIWAIYVFDIEYPHRQSLFIDLKHLVWSSTCHEDFKNLLDFLIWWIICWGIQCQRYRSVYKYSLVLSLVPIVVFYECSQPSILMLFAMNVEIKVKIAKLRLKVQFFLCPVTLHHISLEI